ncbi:MAG: DUF4065 domain-containing protein [Mesorhizobium sp.]|nr:MAG: DUF4065 domain-containing protein [Mesorhizobium sp.]
MSYPAIQIANELIARHGADGRIEPMKLQKLLYFANGWWLALTGRALISEAPQVWRYGPVFKPIYHTFSKYGRNPITQPEPSTPLGGAPQRIPQDAVDAQEVQHLLDWVMTEYGWKSGPALSDDTHRPGTPWRKIAERKQFQVPENETIPAYEDWNYFAELARARGYQPVPIQAA